MIISKRTNNLFLISAFTFSCVFTPAESYGMKQFFLLLFIMYNVKKIIAGLSKDLPIMYFSLWLPLFLFAVSVVAGGNIIDTVRSLYIFTFIWISIIAKEYGIDLKKNFLSITFYIAVVIDIFVFLHFFGILPLQSNPVAIWLRTTGNAQLSYADAAIFYYVFYLNACPLMLFVLVNALKENNKIKTIITTLALLFSGTRANVYLAFLVIINYFIFYKKTNLKKIFVYFLLCVVFLAYFDQIITVINQKISIIDSAKSSGDLARYNRTISTVNIILGSYKIFFFGMGAGSSFMANGVLNSASEMSYLEIWRIHGIVSLIFILSMLLFLFWKNRHSVDIIAYVAYLATCVVDPFLMTSTGFLMIMYMFYLQYVEQAKKPQVLCSIIK